MVTRRGRKVADLRRAPALLSPSGRPRLRFGAAAHGTDTASKWTAIVRVPASTPSVEPAAAPVRRTRQRPSACLEKVAKQMFYSAATTDSRDFEAGWPRACPQRSLPVAASPGGAAATRVPSPSPLVPPTTDGAAPNRRAPYCIRARDNHAARARHRLRQLPGNPGKQPIQRCRWP